MVMAVVITDFSGIEDGSSSHGSSRCSSSNSCFSFFLSYFIIIYFWSCFHNTVCQNLLIMGLKFEKQFVVEHLQNQFFFQLEERDILNILWPWSHESQWWHCGIPSLANWFILRIVNRFNLPPPSPSPPSPPAFSLLVLPATLLVPPPPPLAPPPSTQNSISYKR